MEDQHGAQERNSTLHIVAKKDDLEGVQILLEYGADPHPENKNGKRPADLTTSKLVKAVFDWF